MTANGHVQLSVNPAQSVGVKQPKRLYRNLADGTFAPVEGPELLGDLSAATIARGLATGDIDNDGFVDVLATNQNDPAQLFRNRGKTTNKTIGFKLIGTKSNRDGSHARIRLTDAAGGVHTDWVRAGSSYLSASDRRVYVGLGTVETAAKVEIRWPSGAIDRLTDLAAGSLYAVTEGKGVTEKRPFRK